MEVTPIVAQLRQYFLGFEGRVAGAIYFEAVTASAKPSRSSAYVIPIGGKAGVNTTQTCVQQDISDKFDVMLALDTHDDRGQEPADLVHVFCAEL